MNADEAQRFRMIDHAAQNAVTTWQWSDQVALRLGQSVGDEVGETAAASKHSQCAVSRVGEFAGRHDDPVEDAVQVEVGADSHDGIQQGAHLGWQLGNALGLAGHGDRVDTGPSTGAVNRRGRRPRWTGAQSRRRYVGP
ncbi:MAG: hypothetical protein WKF82_10325 [Nocardioidaceae bacterium]